MVPIAAYILHVVAGYLAEDSPSTFLRALGLVLLTAIAVFFAFDVSSYLFALMMRDPSVGITFPPGFTYWDWMREPLILKWRVMGLVPFIRIVPLLIALIVGCLVQVFVWKVEFKIGLAVFLAQAILTVAAMLALSFIFRLGIVYYEHYMPPQGAQPAHARAPRGHDRNAPPGDLEEMADRAHEQKGRGETFWHNLDKNSESFNVHLAPMYAFLEPVTEHLPHPIHDFLNAGGWLLVRAAGPFADPADALAATAAAFEAALEAVEVDRYQELRFYVERSLRTVCQTLLGDASLERCQTARAPR
jgi:hypothetical protein